MMLDLMLKLNPIDTNGLYIFDNRLIPTPNEAINRSIPEKIRRFNNSSAHLMMLHSHMNTYSPRGKRIIDECIDKATQADFEFRGIIRSIVMEAFIYREKMINIICNIFFVEYKKDYKKVLKDLLSVSKEFPKLKSIIDEIEGLTRCESYNFIMKIRNDEIHNMSILDSFNWNIIPEGNGVRFTQLDYRISAKELFNKVNELMNVYLKIKNLIQSTLNDSIVAIYKKRDKMEVPFCVNMNETFDEE